MPNLSDGQRDILRELEADAEPGPTEAVEAILRDLADAADAVLEVLDSRGCEVVPHALTDRLRRAITAADAWEG